MRSRVSSHAARVLLPASPASWQRTHSTNGLELSCRRGDVARRRRMDYRDVLVALIADLCCPDEPILFENPMPEFLRDFHPVVK